DLEHLISRHGHAAVDVRKAIRGDAHDAAVISNDEGHAWRVEYTHVIPDELVERAKRGLQRLAGRRAIALCVEFGAEQTAAGQTEAYHQLPACERMCCHGCRQRL